LTDTGGRAEPDGGAQGDIAEYRRRLAAELEVEENHRRPLWRHPALLVGVVVVIIVAVSVITDFPVSASHSDTVASVRGYVEEIETDIAPCNYAMGNAWQLYQSDITGSATPTERGEIPSLIQQDLEACSYLQDDIVDLAGIATSASEGANVRGLSTATLAWIDPDALGAITDIATLVSSPSSTSELKGLARREADLVRDRATALRILAGASTTLHAHFPALSLWKPPANS
jgi:hypothetical protein